MEPSDTIRDSVLLLDDGELDDVCEVIYSLTSDVCHLRGGAIPERLDPPERLFVATSRRAVVAGGWPTPRPGEGPVRVAIVTDDSNTLRSMLRRIGFDLLVRRPFHPYALRLLFLRALYAGDERRREIRQPIGAEVWYRQGLRRRSAILADLSPKGCRLLSERNIAVGTRVTIQFSKELAGRKPIPMRAKAVRSANAKREARGEEYSIGMMFEDLTVEARQQVERILQGASELSVLPDEIAKNLRPNTPVETAVPSDAFSGAEGAEGMPEPAGDLRSEDFEGEEITAGSTLFLHEPRLLDEDGLHSRDEESEPASAAQAATEDGDEAAAGSGDDAAVETAKVAAAAPSPGDSEPSEPQSAVPDAEAVEEEAPVPTTFVMEDDAPTPIDVLDDDPPTVPDYPNESAENRLPLAAAGSMEERRKEDRAEFTDSVVQLGDEANRVLVGRDLSPGGMRVDPQADLTEGMSFKLALYGAAREEPFIVSARVLRNEGPAGVALQFENVTPTVAARLEAMVAELPPVETLQDGELGNIGTVVSEILEGDLFDD